jgi:hypothetical protein
MEMAFGFLGNEEITKSWSTMIVGGKGLGAGLMKDIERLIDDSGVPDTKVSQQRVFPGVLQSVLGGGRPYIVIRNVRNPNIKPYKMYISVRDYGINLQISWFLVYKPSGLQKLAQLLLRIPVVGLVVLPFYAVSKLAASKQSGVFGLNVFDTEDLSAYVTNSHLCVADAIDQLGEEHEEIQTPNINRDLGGFLGVG